MKKRKVGSSTVSSIDINTDIIINEDMLIAKRKSLPLIGHLKPKKQYIIIRSLLGISFVGLLVSGIGYQQAKKKELDTIQQSAKLMANVDKMKKEVSKVMLGNKEGITNLINLSNGNATIFNDMWPNINKKENDVMLIVNDTLSHLNEINVNISYIGTHRDVLVDKAKAMSFITQKTGAISGKINKLIQSDLLNKQEVGVLLVGLEHLKSINTDISLLFYNDNQESSLLIRKVGSSLQELKKGLSVIGSVKLGDILGEIRELEGSVGTIYQMYGGRVDSVALLNKFNEQVDFVNKKLIELTNIYMDRDPMGSNKYALFLVLSLFILLSSGAINLIAYNFNTYNTSLLDKLLANQGEQSILKLLSEMMPLQSGDLTKKATVTKEIAGAVADSINATIDSLASLVNKIKSTSLLMDDKAEEVNEIANRMLAVANEQTKSLDGARGTVDSITLSIMDIANKTDQSAKDAQNSVELSKKGAVQVGDSISAMKDIDLNMEEIVRLMMKVNNSSKQISEIVDLLSEITEKTSVLALNATVQAAKSDEQGKGFKIVADSIKDLANEAVSASKRVSDLIKAVQDDIGEVGEAVKKTTDGVERGVRSSESAGESLEKIIVSSVDLAEQVALVSKDANKYAKGTKAVNESMSDLLEITEENRQSSVKTVQAIKDILKISKELAGSVQSFKL